MSNEPSFKPSAVDRSHLKKFLEAMIKDCDVVPHNIIVDYDGIPMYAQTIPIPLITGGTILTDPEHGHDWRITSFEEIEPSLLDEVGFAAQLFDEDGKAIKQDQPTAPKLIRVVKFRSEQDQWFLDSVRKKT